MGVGVRMDHRNCAAAVNLTLVAYYGDKPEPLGALLGELQDCLQDYLGDAFRPYALAQVHATIIGLEGTPEGSRVINTNYLQLRAQHRSMDLRKALAIVQHSRL